MAIGKVYLVGAGPGDPGLITLRAAEVLRAADVVLYDYLANPVILRHCKAGARLISLGKHGSGRIVSQEEVNAQLVQLAQQGSTVVRLKSGDPMIFARASEELDCLVGSRIPFEIVPGVTAGLAAASYAGIPVTNREAASAVALITGQEDADKSDSAIDYRALAKFPGTLIFYMGVTTVEHWSQSLIAAGKPAATPAMIARRVSLPDQERIITTLGKVAETVARFKLRPPAVFLVGEVAATSPAASWFEQRPLFGQTVLVTRPTDQAEALALPLEQLGAEVLAQPAIEILPPQPRCGGQSARSGALPHTDWSEVDRRIQGLDRYDWLVFSSANGVRFFLDRLVQLGRDLRALGKAKIAVVGPGTAEELARYHLHADVIPPEYRAESLAESLASQAANQRFLLVRASRGREVLAEALAKSGGLVEQVVAYESVDVTIPHPDIAARLAAGEIDWTTVTSSAIARSLVQLFGDGLKRTKLVSISPITSATLRELGLETAVEAQEYTMAGVVQALRAAALTPAANL